MHLVPSSKPWDYPSQLLPLLQLQVREGRLHALALDPLLQLPLLLLPLLILATVLPLPTTSIP